MARSKKQNHETPAKALVTKAPSAMSQPVRGLGRGLEEVEQRDVQLGRLKLLQSTSTKELQSIKGAKPGDIINNMSNVNYGNKLTITPIFLFKSRLKWVDREEGEGQDCSAPNGKIPLTAKYATACEVCPHKEWTKNERTGQQSAPLCTEYYNFAVLVNDETIPVVLSCDRSKIKVARKLISMVMMAASPNNPTPDMWCRQYGVTTKSETNTKGTFFNFVLALKGNSPAPISQLAESIYLSLKKVNIQVKDAENATPEVE